MLGFIDATTHLFKRSCPSVGPSVRPMLFSKDENEVLMMESPQIIRLTMLE